MSTQQNPLNPCLKKRFHPSKKGVFYFRKSYFAGAFSIDAATGKVRLETRLDVSATSSFDITAEVTDGLHTEQVGVMCL